MTRELIALIASLREDRLATTKSDVAGPVPSIAVMRLYRGPRSDVSDASGERERLPLATALYDD